MGRAFLRRGRGRLAGSFIEAALISKPDSARRLRGSRGLAKAAPHRRADCRGGRRFGGHYQPHPRTPGPQPPVGARAGRTGPSLWTGRPGEIVHIDIKKLGKFNRIGRRITGDRTGQSNTRRVGWEYVHLAIDDHSRLAYSEILPDEKRTSCLRFLFNALRFFRGFGVRVERVMTDNGSSFRSHRYAKALRRLKIKHLRTRPYTPRTNGKAERFVQISLSEWAYARAYRTSDERAAELPVWLHGYNWHRPHGSIGSKPPISSLSLTRTTCRGSTARVPKGLGYCRRSALEMRPQPSGLDACIEAPARG
jgi:transposase InsO family protein